MKTAKQWSDELNFVVFLREKHIRAIQADAIRAAAQIIRYSDIPNSLTIGSMLGEKLIAKAKKLESK